MRKENLTPEQEADMGDVVVVKSEGVSPIWLVPIVAALVGLYIVYKSYVEAGIPFTIAFESGEGIEAGKTTIVVRGITVGKVDRIEVNQKLDGVKVMAIMDRRAISLLKESSDFWLVQPQISLSGISGLEALISGNYIAVRPGDPKADDSTEFEALTKAPPLGDNAPGLHLTLSSDELGSVSLGTQIYYRKIPVGEVQNFQLNDAGDGVELHVHIKQQYEYLVNNNTRFWNSSGVNISGSLSGIEVKTESLTSIMSGGISFYNPVGLSTSTNSVDGDRFYLFGDFTSAEEGVTIKASDLPGLKVVLESEELGSISEGTKIYYRKIPVGEVRGYTLNQQGTGVDLQAFIQKPFAHLVKENSRFWHSSGINISGGLSGIKVRTESLASIISGGISFYTPEDGGQHAVSNQNNRFELYDGFEEAETGVSAKIFFDSGIGLNAGSTQVKMGGVVVGVVKTIDIASDLNGIWATVLFDPIIETSINAKTQFWLVQPKISLKGVSGLDTIISGSYINMDVDKSRAAKKAKAKDEFIALAEPPRASSLRPGLRIQVTTKELGSIDVGSSVFYRKLPVGEVEAYRLADTGKEIVVDLLIENKFKHLVNAKTRFWNASGISISGGLSGIKVRAESLMSIVSGGIAFENFEEVQGEPSDNGDKFSLYADLGAAEATGTFIQIAFQDGEGISDGTLLKYRGVTVGKVTSVTINKNFTGVNVKALMDNQHQHLTRANTKFWLVGAQLGLTGAQDLGTLISGEYIELEPGDGEYADSFVAEHQSPYSPKVFDGEGLHIVLTSERLGSIKKGISVNYREIPVGEVVGYELNDVANGVNIHLMIQQKYAPLVRSGSRFWDASGIGIDIGLFSGASIRTESVESILSGGISFATPDGGDMGMPVTDGTSFRLRPEVKEDWLKWNPEISLRTVPAIEAKVSMGEVEVLAE